MRSLFLALLVGCSGEAPVAPVPAPEPIAAPAPPPVPTPPPAAPPGEVKPGDAASGAEIYKANCLACHQADGTGMGGMLAVNFIKEKERLQKSDPELMRSIREGVTGKKGTMPGWKATLSEQEMADALAYLRKTFGEP